MDERYRRFAKAGARNILDYNQRVAAGRVEDGEHMHYIIVVVDELADLMMLAPDETERVITRLAQMARATGIHIIISTQRPSVDVVTGLIKANFPARIAFAVATGVDSRVILDMPGAEKLLGRGDMLFQAPDAPMPVRAQGVFVSDQEIQRIVDYWRGVAKERPQPEPGDGRPEAEAELASALGIQQPTPSERKGSGDDADDLYEDAVALARENMGKVSVPLLQRRLRIGNARATRLIDIMRERGVLDDASED
jgi:S-DNA-T family DNA segregation ATPase FtsK/SpoIIIE